jgi:deoxyribodipyrimidine photo-lyase
VQQLRELARETGARRVYWNRHFEPAARATEAALEQTLRSDEVEVWIGEAATLHPPGTVLTQNGTPFQVFTPFWRRSQQLDVEPPGGGPLRPWSGPATWPRSDSLADWHLRTGKERDSEFARHWEPGEAGAHRRLNDFLAMTVDAYEQGRNLPAIDGTSRLSPHLRFGEVSARQVWAAVMAASRDSGVRPRSRGAYVFLSELGWREFSHHLLWHYPQTPTEPLRGAYANFPWQTDPAARRAWQEGRTGFPLVDAGMRELGQTGWMHNRVRMIAASFLVKHLLQPWTDGAAWFWETLVDADLANNTMGWQWSAGCGADAAPFFRVFNPTRQGERFDPGGIYVRRWVPELADVPNKWIHQPWTMPGGAGCGGAEGRPYPAPVIDPAEGRKRALAVYAAWQRRRRTG